MPAMAYVEAGSAARRDGPALPELPHLSEDEAGGGGAAVRTLQPAASGVGPSVGLATNTQRFTVSVRLSESLLVPSCMTQFKCARSHGQVKTLQRGEKRDK